MPADHLTGASSSAAAAGPESTTHALERAVLAVLAGAPAESVAADAVVTVPTLIDAAERYRIAGRAALAAPTAADGWQQVHLEFPGRAVAEHAAVTVLSPALRELDAAEGGSTWWYVRKAPCWKVRVRTKRTRQAALPPTFVDAINELASRRQLTSWTTGVYEPETRAFGGDEAMATAHRFFHADSVSILDHLGRTGFRTATRPDLLGRRELSLLLCCALLRGAGQDWHEQGDVWHRVTQMRTLPLASPPEPLPDLVDKVGRLLRLDTERAVVLVDPQSPLSSARPWLDAATRTGHELHALARTGSLRRGLRDVLAHHVVFHWNRLGVSDAAQAVLAHASVTAVFGAADREGPTVGGQP